MTAKITVMGIMTPTPMFTCLLVVRYLYVYIYIYRYIIKYMHDYRQDLICLLHRYKQCMMTCDVIKRSNLYKTNIIVMLKVTSL